MNRSRTHYITELTRVNFFPQISQIDAETVLSNSAKIRAICGNVFFTCVTSVNEANK